MLAAKESKIAVIRSLIASSIFLVFLKPILEFLWAVLVIISKHTYTFYIDSVYKNAALGQRNWIDFITFTFIIVMLLAALMTITYLLHQRNLIFRLKEEISKEKDSEKLSKLTALLSKKITRFNKKSRLSNFFLTKRIIVYVITTFITFSFLFTAYADLQLNSSFNQRLTIIAPYLTDSEFKMLKSKWALMESRKDFDIINIEIESIANQNKIVLPKNLLK